MSLSVPTHPGKSHHGRLSRDNVCAVSAYTETSHRTNTSLLCPANSHWRQGMWSYNYMMEEIMFLNKPSITPNHSCDPVYM